jgi:hypothetical protein
MVTHGDAKLHPEHCVTTTPIIGGGVVTRWRSENKQGDALTRAGAGQSLTDLADRLSRLTPCHRDPHAYHDGKRSIVAELRRLARRME